MESTSTISYLLNNDRRILKTADDKLYNPYFVSFTFIIMAEIQTLIEMGFPKERALVKFVLTALLKPLKSYFRIHVFV